jgi:hypothetical protein
MADFAFVRKANWNGKKPKKSSGFRLIVEEFKF